MSWFSGLYARLAGGAILLALMLTLFLAMQQRGEPALVDSVAVVERDLSATLHLTGEVINDRMVTMTALLDGEITSIRVRTGNEVAAGAILATLDERLAGATRDKAAATLANARQRLEAIIRSHRRLTLLSRRRDVSEQTLEDSLVTLQNAVSAVALAAADLDMAELHWQNATIRAPFDAIVIEQVAEKGQWVEAGTRLFTLVALSGLTVEALVDVADAARVTVGQRVWLESDAFPGRHWQSEISWRAPSIEQDDELDRNAFAVRMPPGDDAPPLLIGQQIDVRIEFERRNRAPSLPLAALTQTRDGAWSVWVENDGTAHRQRVDVGLKTIDHAEITDGLAIGEKVLLANQSLVQGQRVQPVSPQETP